MGTTFKQFIVALLFAIGLIFGLSRCNRGLDLTSQPPAVAVSYQAGAGER